MGYRERDAREISSASRRPVQPVSGVHYGRRRAFLHPDETFYDHVNVTRALFVDEKMRALFESARLKVAPAILEGITVFFEIYGGEYPHPDVPVPSPKPACVQTKLWYCPM